MSKADFQDPSNYFDGFHPHAAFYSYNGCGKSTLAGMTGLKTVLLDCGDAGAVTVRKAENLKIVRIKSIKHYLEIIEELGRIKGIELLVVDTLTGLQSIAIKEVKGKGEMSQRKWGSVNGKVIECISETKGFPNDVIYLMQEKRKSKEEDTGTVQLIGPSLTPGSREALSGSVDWVGRLFIEENVRKISFQLTDYVEAKDRGDLFPKIIKWTDPKQPIYLNIRKRIVENISNLKESE